jgi:hypothetical protein
MASLDDYELKKPVGSMDKLYKTIETLDGLNKESAIVLARGFNLLSEFDEPKATYERIAWLNIWSKSVNCLRSAIPSYDTQNNLALKILCRSTFQWTLHCLVIMDPILDLYSQKLKSSKVRISLSSEDLCLKRSIQRLQAYAAWCLWSDLLHYKEISHSKTLDGVYDPNPAKEIMKDKERLFWHEKFFGKLDIETDEIVLKKGRIELEQYYMSKIEQIENLLADQLLKPWIDKIKASDTPCPSFFSLFANQTSLPKYLFKHGLRFAYGQYSLNSMILHGSTMEQFLIFSDTSISPRDFLGDLESDGLFENIIKDCNKIFSFLAFFNQKALHRPELRV